MNTSVEGIIVNNCQYAPIYLIQDPGATQANTYVLAPSLVDQPKPISNNLKAFYENSGNIENGLVNVNASVRPTLPKNKEGVLIGNNLKLASFLLPKTENVNKQYVVDNVVLKSNVTTTTGGSVQVNTVPKINIDRKIVKLKEVPSINRTRPEKVLPKIKPKENIPSPNQSKHTSVQLIKLGETYHSLNHLSKDQVKMVNQALKMFKDPDKTKSEPTYDPITNTRYIYKVVSPKDLTVVGQKKIILKEKKLTKIPKRVIEEKMKLMKQMMPVKEIVEEPPEPEEKPVETKVTRSGRKVKLPRQILPEDSPHKSKKKTGTIISCFQCSAEFGSLYRLQKHYENHPTHIPAKIHSNLFHCLLAIIKSGSEGDKTNIFIQQLEQLIVKLKSLLPCLLSKVDGSEGQPCTINDDVSRLFGMNPGKYNIDVEALNCVKDKNGYCIHNPPKLNKYINDHKASSLSMHNGTVPSPENETENCARINSAVKWPTVSKRIWKLKPKTQEVSAKKMRLTSEGDTLIDLGTDDFIFNTEENNITRTAAMMSENDLNQLIDNNKECKVNTSSSHLSASNNIEVPLCNNIVVANQGKQKSNYIPFHSAHFDIRSSPIKPSTSTGFVKFQINSSKISKVSKNYQGQVIRALEMNDKNDSKPSQVLLNSDNNLHIPLCQSSNDSLDIPMSTSTETLHIPMSTSNNLLVNLPNLANDLHLGLQNANNNLHVPLSNSDNGQHAKLGNSGTGLHVTLPSSNNSLHVRMQSPINGLHVPLPDSDNLQLPIPNSENNLQHSIPTTDSSLHDIFKDDVDLSCKDDSNIDPVLKEWIISTSEKSENSLPSFTKSSSVIEPVFLHGTDSVDKSMNKNDTHNCDMPSLDVSDSRLMASQSESVLNFLETLGNDLVYPETEIRNNGVDFQLDLFTFDNS